MEEKKQETESQASVVPPVLRTKEQAKRLYDRISRVYDYLIAAIHDLRRLTRL